MPRRGPRYTVRRTGCLTPLRGAGTVAREARGEYMVAKVAVAIGLPDLALRHAGRCLRLVSEHPQDMADWDAPFAHEAYARALALTGDPAGAASHWARAQELAEQVADPEDREILATERAREPRVMGGWTP